MAAPSQPLTPRYGAALTIIQDLYGWIINEVESFPTLGIVQPTAPFVNQNADRVGLLIMNGGANSALVALNSSVFTSTQFLLTQNGGSISFNIRDDFTLVSRAFWGFTNVSPGNIYVLELIAVRPLAKGSQ